MSYSFKSTLNILDNCIVPLGRRQIYWTTLYLCSYFCVWFSCCHVPYLLLPISHSDRFSTTSIRARFVWEFKDWFIAVRMEGTNSTMIKLTHSNWVTWKPRMEDILYCTDLHEPIEGDDANPEGTTPAIWTKMNRKAIGHIREWVDDSVFHHVANETSAHELWLKLESLFEKKDYYQENFSH